MSGGALLGLLSLVWLLCFWVFGTCCGWLVRDVTRLLAGRPHGRARTAAAVCADLVLVLVMLLPALAPLLVFLVPVYPVCGPL